MTVLTAVDVVGIQRFVFATNRLRDAIGASQIVEWTTSVGGGGALVQWCGHVRVSGGGTAQLEFESLEAAQEFARRYTRRLFDECPDLDVAVVHQEFDGPPNAGHIQDLKAKLARAKATRPSRATPRGYSVTAECRESGGVAHAPLDRDPAEDHIPLSLGVRQRRGHARRARVTDATQEFLWPAQFDDLGRTLGERSLLGVVHIDLNGVGVLIDEWSDKVSSDARFGQQKTWAGELDQLMGDMWNKIQENVATSVAVDGDGAPYLGAQRGATDVRIPLAIGGLEGAERPYLPLRMVLRAGDDLTFVCDGRIAVELARGALNSIVKYPEVQHLGKIGGAAGVSIVPVGYPFSRAYEISERLCQNAKLRCRTAGGNGMAALDWHLGVIDSADDADLRRDSQRPYLSGAGTGCLDWFLDEVVQGFASPPWSERRTKAKELCDLIRQGQYDVARLAFEKWDLSGTPLPLPGGIDQQNLQPGVSTAILDALELADIHHRIIPAKDA